MSLTPEQQKYYALYLSDPDPTPLGVGNKNAAIAAVISLFLPGVGHLYLEQPGWALAWFAIGVLVLPLAAPVAAAIDTSVANKALVADAYMPLYHAKEARRRREQEQQERQTQVPAQVQVQVQTQANGQAQAVAPLQPPPATPAPATPAPPAAPEAHQLVSVACRACGLQSPASARFCSACGDNLQPLPGEQVYCAGCGVPYLPDARFCQSCGGARE